MVFSTHPAVGCPKMLQVLHPATKKWKVTGCFYHKKQRNKFWNVMEEVKDGLAKSYKSKEINYRVVHSNLIAGTY